jgi:hypothetical protein
VRPSSVPSETTPGPPGISASPSPVDRGVPPDGGLRGRWWLESGGWLAALMGAAHFVLPVVYPWGTHVEGVYPPVRWGLWWWLPIYSMAVAALHLAGLWLRSRERS